MSMTLNLFLHGLPPAMAKDNALRRGRLPSQKHLVSKGFQSALNPEIFRRMYIASSRPSFLSWFTSAPVLSIHDDLPSATSHRGESRCHSRSAPKYLLPSVTWTS